MLHLAFEKVEIYQWKKGFVDCQWSNLNTPGSYTSWSHSLLGSAMGCPFPSMQEREMLHLTCDKVEIHFSQIGFLDCKWSNLNAPGSYTPWCHSLLVSTVGCLFLCMQEKGMLHVSVNKVEIKFSKIGFVDCKWSNLNASG